MAHIIGLSKLHSNLDADSRKSGFESVFVINQTDIGSRGHSILLSIVMVEFND